MQQTQSQNTQDTIDNMTIGSGSFTVPTPPSFEDPYQQRAYDKQRLAAAFRVFALHGFDEGLAGHITVRDAVEKDTFWSTRWLCTSVISRPAI